MKQVTTESVLQRMNVIGQGIASGRISLHEEFELSCLRRLIESEAKCAELAAEVYDVKHPGTYLPSKCDTPAAEAIMAEVRAQGVEMFAVNLAHYVHRSEYSQYFEEEALKFAAQLRKGVQS